MLTLTIDNQTVSVPEGASVLAAAERLGIVIPHFCYHEALGAVGACRLCAMKFLEGPVKGVHMSCMVEVKEGMVVSTLDPEAAELRTHVIEWLMMNHPHDCPVCDEGGECQLQDMTIAGGHGIRRYRGPKRTYANQALGPFVEQEMNRCIQCYRCVRTYRDYCGGTDFGVLGSRNRLVFGRVRSGALESPFSGNLVDVCPTGVFTDKPFRFTSRIWDLEEAPSVCPHCSLGCSTIPGARNRELQRVRSGVNRQVNGFFICDRGRFGYGHANHPERPRTPRVEGAEATWPQALDALRRRLKETVREHGPGSVAFLGSPRASLEANWLLGSWAQRLGSERIAFESHPQRDRAARTVAAGLGERTRSLDEVRRSDFVLLVGVDPLAEGPLLGLAARQVVRSGNQVAVLDPRPVELPCAASHLPLLPEQLPQALTSLAGVDFASFDRQQAIVLEGIAARLREAKNPVLAGGADLLGAAGIEALLAVAERLSTPERPCGATVLLAGPNSYGAALLAGAGPDIDTLLDAVLAGEVKTLVCLEADPFADHPDAGRVEAALARLATLVVLDSLSTVAVRRADLLLPTTVPAEGDGTFVNQEGRMLPFASVFSPGIPLRVTGEGDHPPRTFEQETPGSRPRPAWAILAALLGHPVDLIPLQQEIEASDPRFAGLSALVPGGEGVRVAGPGQLPPAAPALPQEGVAGALCLLPVTATYGSDLLASLSPPLAAVTPAPYFSLHPADAEARGLADGDRALLTTHLGHQSLPVRLSSRQARGLALIPRLCGTASASLLPGAGVLDCTLKKEGPA